MKKKNNRQLIDRNIIMFPGTVERLIDTGHEHAEKQEYELAIEAFRQANLYDSLDVQTLSVFTYALYETRNFEEARSICEILLAKGPTQYIEVMELYLSICMELRDFYHVQQIILTLFEEEAIPKEASGKFKSILSLSEKLAELSAEEPEEVVSVDAEDFHTLTFFQLPLFMQMRKLQSLVEVNIRPISSELKAIIEAENAHPMVKSIALYVLVDQQVALDVTIEKFGHSKTVNTADLKLPDELPIAKKVTEEIVNALEKESSALEMVQFLLTRHILVTYPFEWFQFNEKSIVEGYIKYVHMLFGQNEQVNEDFNELIIRLEKYSDIPET